MRPYFGVKEMESGFTNELEKRISHLNSFLTSKKLMRKKIMLPPTNTATSASDTMMQRIIKSSSVEAE